LNRQIAQEVVGFDFERGRLDASAHPFSVGIAKDDVRITTRLRSSSLLSGLRSTVHEAGHALYELNRNPKYDGQPVQNYVSVAVHESQSLFWERHVIMGRSFWEVWWNRVKEVFNIQNGDANDVYKAVNAVNFNNLIRVEAGKQFERDLTLVR
jgi:carboxypeptidase Taq